MTRRTARKIWWNTSRWHLYRVGTIDRAKQRFLSDRGLTVRKCGAPDPMADEDDVRAAAIGDVDWRALDAARSRVEVANG